MAQKSTVPALVINLKKGAQKWGLKRSLRLIESSWFCIKVDWANKKWSVEDIDVDIVEDMASWAKNTNQNTKGGKLENFKKQINKFSKEAEKKKTKVNLGLGLWDLKTSKIFKSNNFIRTGLRDVMERLFYDYAFSQAPENA